MIKVDIPERFLRAVLSHAISVLSIERYPMILAIQGKPGDGKSFQTAFALRSFGFRVHTFSSVLLGGNLEGHTVKKLQELYQRAHEAYLGNPKMPPAIVLEDFDMSPAGQRDLTRYTVNSQLLTGFLMNLTEDVGSCEVGTTERYPIFMTGNDYSVIHGPLARPGRINFFSWLPDREERAMLIRSALRPYAPRLTDTEALSLARRFENVPVSGFVAAANDCIARRACDWALDNKRIDLQLIRARFAAGNVELSTGEIEEAVRARQGMSRRPGKYA